ncbi:MAG: hypothetical protein ACJ8F1_00360, partial [Polyangia bacterium]
PSSDTIVIALGLAAGVPAPGSAPGCPAAVDAAGAAAREPAQAAPASINEIDNRTDDGRDMRGIKSRGLRARQPAD